MTASLRRWMGLVILIAAGLGCDAGGQTAATQSAADTSPQPRSPAAETTLADFEDLLLNFGIAKLDFGLIEQAMRDPFTLGYWHSEGSTLPPADAVSVLRDSYLTSGSSVQIDRSANISSLMDDLDPIAMMPPDANIVDIIYSTGWGPDGKDEAVLYISQESNGGRFYLYGMVIASGGFVAQPAPTLTATDSGSGHGVPQDYSGFQTALLKAIVDRDYDAMYNMMAVDDFTIGYWHSEGQNVTRDYMKNALRTNFLPPTNYVYYTLDKDINSLLGQPLSSMFSFKDGNKYSGAVYFEGWGLDGKAQSIVIIAQNDSGFYFWWGMLYAAIGF